MPHPRRPVSAIPQVVPYNSNRMHELQSLAKAHPVQPVPDVVSVQQGSESPPPRQLVLYGAGHRALAGTTEAREPQNAAPLTQQPLLSFPVLPQQASLASVPSACDWQPPHGAPISMLSSYGPRPAGLSELAAASV